MKKEATENVKALLMIVLALAIACVLGQLSKACHREQPAAEPDTIIIRDTITTIIRDTIPIEVRRTVTRRDTVTVVARDTDTVTVTLPVEQAVYSGANYTAYVSGYHPRLDSITVTQEQAIETRTIYRESAKTRHWALGLQAGYGLTPRRAPQPYIGIGISYNIFTW